MVTFQAIKDPDSNLDYTIDWSQWLALGDTIVTSSWILPTGVTQVTSSNTATTATVWLSGGVAGRSYIVTNRITTASSPSRQDERSIQITVQDR